MRNKKTPWLHSLHAVHKLMMCFIIAAITFLFVIYKNIDTLSCIMITWDAFSISLLIIDWIIFCSTPIQQIRAKAKAEDSSSVLISVIVIVSAFASMLAVILLLVSKDEEAKPLHIIAAITGMVFSWLLVHTIFTVRYAHLYYSDNESNANIHAGGLEFPEKEDKPDFLDFAYFSFVLGMTFQVSDVQITSKNFRRLALLHGLLSFAYNTVIVAITINVVAGLGEK
jgi:uncharacterized membrane protein